MASGTKSGSAAHLLLKEWDEGMWSFEYPRIGAAEHERLHEAVDRMHAGAPTHASRLLRKLIRDFPEFIDARHHLAVFVDWEFPDSGEPRLLWEDAVKQGMRALPPAFRIGRDRLEWGFLDNRPFLRAYHALGLAYLAEDLVGQAAGIFQDLLDLNPEDNQGIRDLAINAAFLRRRPGDVLAVCARFPGDGLPAVMYGRVLALFQLGRTPEAADALRHAASFSPKVAAELRRTQHRRPPSAMPGFVTFGGADEAYAYWETHGAHWKSFPGALEFVRGTLGPGGTGGRPRGSGKKASPKDGAA